MLLRMIEENEEEPGKYPLDRIVFSDTTFEFPELYEYLDRIQAYIDSRWPHLGLKIERINADRTWDDWFFGKITSGAGEGSVRGAPLKAYPCWWSREAKVKPLNKAAKEMGKLGTEVICYHGIAYDEKHRMAKDHMKKGYRYPLIDWKWTEQDALAYLDHLGLGLILYEAFNRLGCFHCPKQPPSSWFHVWKNYPKEWEIALHYDRESIRLTPNSTGMYQPMALDEMESRFKIGWIPKDNSSQAGLSCNTCSAVAFAADGTITDEDFDTDGAVERTDGFKGSRLEQMMNDEIEEKTVWVPPSHLRAENVEAAGFDTWFCESGAYGLPAPTPEQDCLVLEDEEE